MSNPTNPFSWQMPTSTDLVTDLPADFEVFGQAVATSMADLLGGSSGYILSKNSATDMDFVWVAPTPGKILQVVFATTTTETTNSTNTYADTNCTVSITPSSVSSRVMLIVNHNGWNKSSADTGNFIETQLLRSATQIMFVSNGNRTSDQTLDLTIYQTLMYVDSPATTSATTYKTQFRNGRNGASVGINYGGSRSTIVALEIGA